MTCKIIKSFSELSFTAIKITPHFHESTEGLIIVAESNGFSIFEETNGNTTKDTSRMLSAGAGMVYFAQVLDDKLVDAFNTIMDRIPANTPVICESPALRNYIEPGAFIIMDSDSIYNKKNIRHLQKLPHVMFKLEDLDSISLLPLEFKGGKWLMK